MNSKYEPNEPARARRVELVTRIERFIDGSDVSVESARLIEAGLDDAFPDNDWVSAKVLMLAGYHPGSSDALHDEAHVRAALVEVLARLRRS
jgi:hypothetical protein